MRGIAKMMTVTAATRDKESDRRDYDRHKMALPYMGGDYDMYDRFRDRRGREHYDNGRYAPRNESTGTLTWDTTHDAERRRHEPMDNYPRYEMDEMESRRRRDRRGRFRSDMDEPDMHYPMPYPFPPPVYENYGGMNQIGFSAHDGEEREGLRMIRGGGSGHSIKLDKEMAEEWMENLENEDGTTGPHWPMEQTKQVMAKRGFDCDPLEWWVAMNAMYSDYAKVAKKHNVNNIDFYADLAKAWLHDPDAVDGKAAAYYQFIVK